MDRRPPFIDPINLYRHPYLVLKEIWNKKEGML